MDKIRHWKYFYKHFGSWSINLYLFDWYPFTVENYPNNKCISFGFLTIAWHNL